MSDLPNNEGAEHYDTARMGMWPEMRAAEVLPAIGCHQPESMAALLAELREQSSKAHAGDFGRGVGMLVSQAHMLDALLQNVLQRMTVKPERFTALMPLALKTQAQCRATWDSVALLRAESKGGRDGAREG